MYSPVLLENSENLVLQVNSATRVCKHISSYTFCSVHWLSKLMKVSSLCYRLRDLGNTSPAKTS